jgi:hypothetical protein
MRISILVCASFVLAAMSTCDSVASDQRVEGFLLAAATFLPQAESPVLFLGQIVEADSGRLCLQGNQLSGLYLLGEHRAIRICSARSSEGGVSGLRKIASTAFLWGRGAGARNVLWA